MARLNDGDYYSDYGVTSMMCLNDGGNGETSEVFEASRTGNAAELSELLQQMNNSERTTAIEMRSWMCKPPHLYERLGQHDWRFDMDESPETIEITPLIIASCNGNFNCVKILLKYKADIEGRGGKDPACGGFGTFTPVFAAASYGRLDVLRCLVENGADVNARTDNTYWTPLMAASFEGHAKAITYLVKHGANMDLQDDDGNTALHHAIEFCIFMYVLEELDPPLDPAVWEKPDDLTEVAKTLLTLGASQLCNNRRLTPLLKASKECSVPLVEELIRRPEFNQEQRIDALEFLGASIALTENEISNRTSRSFKYIKRGMEERFKDLSHPLLKQPMDPVEAYQNRKESQTLEELAQIENDFDAIIMESLVMYERFLGTDSLELHDSICSVARYYNDDKRKNFDICVGLYKYAMEIAQCCNKSIALDSGALISIFYRMVQNKIPPKQKVVIEVIEDTVLGYTKQQENLQRQLEDEPDEQLKLKLEEKFKKDVLSGVLDNLLVLLQSFAKGELCEEDNETSDPVSLPNLSRLNPRDVRQGNTLLHMAVVSDRPPYHHPCAKTTTLLLNAGISVNATNNNGDTPLHIAVTCKPANSDMLHHLTETLKVLLDGGAHLDFVNNDGKTAMDLAETDEARWILSEKKTLELECIAARAVKKFGLPYLGLVPKILEKFISMH